MVTGLSGWVLDTPAVTLFAQGHPYARAVVWASMEDGNSLAIPGAALAQAYAATPKHDLDALRVLVEPPITVVDPLDAVRARDVGELLAADQPDELVHEPTALAAAHTVLLYRLRDWPVVTDRTILLHAIHPRVEVRLIRDA
ncbi:hypothetical protein JOF41_003602 [Saccharothrix coeruleofusca]|uniref:hypothetical protein n=1 Tax=Saccharothrix coeruleofusca TaxID=33919 RepID=UPI001AE90C8A|nr:hypothetical protein [Saccharothrix coeruleofusca]MBP2337424.1 hypothetical protein [Saccharothrix coeruleofusca]